MNPTKVYCIYQIRVVDLKTEKLIPGLLTKYIFHKYHNTIFGIGRYISMAVYRSSMDKSVLVEGEVPLMVEEEVVLKEEGVVRVAKEAEKQVMVKWAEQEACLVAPQLFSLPRLLL